MICNFEVHQICVDDDFDEVHETDLKSGSEHLESISEQLNQALAKRLCLPAPDTAHFYYRLNDSDPDFWYCHIVLMDQKYAITPTEGEQRGWIWVGPSISTSPSQIKAFTSRFPEHFTNERFEFQDLTFVPENYIGPDHYIAIGLSAPTELAITTKRCRRDIARSAADEWRTLFKQSAGIRPNLSPLDLERFPHLAEKWVWELAEEWAALGKAGLLFYPHVTIFPRRPVPPS